MPICSHPLTSGADRLMKLMLRCVFRFFKTSGRGNEQFADLLTLEQSKKNTDSKLSDPCNLSLKHDARAEGYWAGNRYWREAITVSFMRNFIE